MLGGARMFEQIAALKRQRNAIVLAHYYQDPDIQDVADILGDSLALARAAQTTDADVIVLCGVHFMAETAKILNPDKRVLVPDLSAGCSLADSCPPDRFAAFIAAHPGHEVVTYVNTSAAVKALSDWVCTSTNAAAIVLQIPAERPILFAPDRNLGQYGMAQTGRDMVLWPGTCMVHETFQERHVLQLLAENPGALLIAHPECEPPILRHAHFVGSTQRLLDYAVTSAGNTFIVATEEGILHSMHKAAPNKTFLPAAPRHASTCGCSTCPHMKKNTLEKVHQCLLRLSPEVTVPEPVRLRALRPIERMVSVG
jgi:quinolinate synthase